MKRPALLLSFLLFVLPSVARTPLKEAFVLSSMAVIENVKEGSVAAAAGVKAGDLVVSINGSINPTLQEVLGYRYDWERSKSTSLGVRRAGALIELNLGQGDWGCEFRADLAGKTPDQLAEARSELKKDETLDAGKNKYESLIIRAVKGSSRDSACWLMLDLGKGLKERRKWKDAVAVFGRAAENAPPDSFWRFSALLKEADAFAGAKENDRASGLYEDVAAAARSTGMEMRLAGALNSWFAFARQSGDLPKAENLARESLEIKERLVPDSYDMAVSLNNMGVVKRSLGQLHDAAENFLKSKTIRERLAPGSLDVAVTLNNLGNVTLDQGDLSAAREYYMKALSIIERLSPESLAVAGSLNNLGSVAKEQGDLNAAREFHFRALAIRERLAPGSQETAMSFTNLGAIARAQGDFPASKEYHLKALSIYKKLAPESLEVALSLNNLGILSSDEDDAAAAKDYHTQALAIRERLAPGSLDVAMSLGNLGNSAYKMKDTSGAKEYYSRALAIRESLCPGSIETARIYYNLGIVAGDSGELDKAKGYYLKALAIENRLAPGSIDVAVSLSSLARAEKSSGNLPRCTELLSDAVDALEFQRSRVGGETAKTSFAAVHGDFYTQLISAYLDSGKPAMALQTLERSRSRALLEMVSSRYVDWKAEIPAALLERQEELDLQRKKLCDALFRADAKTSSDDIEAWRAELLLLPIKEDALAEEIRKSSPRLASLEYPKPLDFDSLRKALEPGTLLLAYAVAEDETYLFALGNTDLRAYRIPMGEKALQNKVRAFRAGLLHEASKGPASDAWKVSSRELYEVLLQPASSEIAKCSRVLLLPDGPLHLLPFTALLPSGRKLPKELNKEPIGVQRPITVEASMTVYLELQKAKAAISASSAPSWIGFGDPLYSNSDIIGGTVLEPLPGTRKEIEAISPLFNGKALSFLGENATEDTVRSLPDASYYLHFACHGILDTKFPMNSALALSIPPFSEISGTAVFEDHKKDGLLQAWEIIEDVKIDSDCVVLSACETGLGKDMGGEGLIGLTRAFQYAGARSVLSSLWSVSDESTAILMKSFYSHLCQGRSKSESLSLAQKEMIKSQKYSHPFFWAGFVLNGDWK
jgi:CHAT domain-containing protein